MAEPGADAGAAFKIFLNYRRTDADMAVGRLWDTLRNGIEDVPGFGEQQIFRDIDTIEPGVDFRDAIQDAVAASDVFLAVIGPDWLNAVDTKGRRRLDNPNDFVRVEIEAALRRAAEHHDVRVVPTLVEDAEMPTADELPDTLAPLPNRQAVTLTNAHWPYEVERLLASLKKLEREKLGQRSARGLPPRWASGRWVAAGAAVVAVAAAGALIARYASGPDTGGRTSTSTAANTTTTRTTTTAVPEEWTQSKAPGVGRLFGVTGDAGDAVIAVGKGSGRPKVVVLKGGDRWVEQTVASGSGTMFDVAVSDGAAVAAGSVNDSEKDVDAAIWTRTGGIWRRVCHDVCGDAAGPSEPGWQTISALTVTPSSFVAVGVDKPEDDWDAAVWFSENGRDWERADGGALGGPGDQVMKGVVGIGNQIVAVGWNGSSGAVWISDDEGRNWTLRLLPPTSARLKLSAVAALTSSSQVSRLVAVGHDEGKKKSAVAWFSDDRGLTWQKAEISNAGDRGQQMVGVAWVGSGWVAVGDDRPDGSSRSVAAVWRSEDGRRWASVSSDDFAGAGGRSMTSAAAFPEGRVIAVGTAKSSGPNAGQVWISEGPE